MRILRALSSRFLWCGCLVGVYETYGGEIVAVIDVRGRTCAEPEHVPDRQVQLSDEHHGDDRVPYNGVLDGCHPKT
jgi:hypothetical protein